MIGRLTEFFLPFIIRYMVHKKETLTQKERRAQEKFLNGLKVISRKTKKPVIVAIIGPVGSGKSSVARELAGLIGADVIEGDEIRVLLRKEGERYEGTRKITENAALEIIKRGGNVIMDSDHIDAKKRASLREKARKASVRFVFICTYCDIDVMSERIRKNDPGIFFNEASSLSKAPDKGKDVKMREMIRRLPHHYRWENKNGGRWVIKNPPCAVLADINTADPGEWKAEVQKLAKKLL